MSELLDLVDQHDAIIGTETRENIYREGLHNYRVVGVFLIDRANRVLLPTRSMLCSYCPGCYDFSAAGHVLTGETYLQAAQRELMEELGIHQDCVEFTEFLYTKYPNSLGLSSFSKYYYAVYNGPLDMQINEVSGAQWLPADHILRLMQEKPQRS